MTLRPSWIAFGWFIAAAVTALVLFGLIAIGVIGEAESEPGAVWVAVALAIGFLVGGFFTGARARTAPVLHGLGIGLVSWIVWFAANLLFGEAAELAGWASLPFGSALALLLLQTVAAILGARLGTHWSGGTAIS